MSTTLPKDAPTNDTAAPSVEEPAPEIGGEVAEESVGSSEDPKVVPAERFNGLMRTFNQTQSELNETRTRLAKLEARLNEQQTSKEPEAPVSDTSSLEARIEQLTEMLTTERRGNALKDALDEYPEAKPFADLIVADTPEDVREMARLIAERAKAANPGTTQTTEEVTEETEPAGEETTVAETEAESTEPPVAGGGAAFSTEASTDDRVVDAIKKGDFASFVNAKWEKTSLGANTAVA